MLQPSVIPGNRFRGGEAIWIVPISGTTKLHRPEENIGAAAIELTRQDLQGIEEAISKISVQVARYPEAEGGLTGR